MSGIIVLLAILAAITPIAVAALLAWRHHTTRPAAGTRRDPLDDLRPELVDDLRYARIAVTIAVDPDDPDQIRMSMSEIAERRPVCHPCAAIILTDLARDLSDGHDGECDR